MAERPLSPADPFAASLTGSFVSVPPSAVPAVIDCVLASAAVSRSELFSALLQAFPDPGEGLQSNYVVSHVTALCHLMMNTGTPDDALRLLVWRVFAPLLRSIDSKDSELLNQINGLLCDVVSKTQSWELMGETLVPFCLRSVGLNVGMLQKGELAVYQWSSEDFMDPGFGEIPLGELPLLMACRILTSFLDTALRRRREIRSLEHALVDGLMLDAFIRNLTWDLSQLALGMIMQGPEYRSFAVRVLLPFVFCSLSELALVTVSVCGSQYTLSRDGLSREIWECCITLFSLGHRERLDAYSILSLYFSLFYHMEACENGTEDSTGELFDMRSLKEFWEEIRRGLVHRDASIRKQALYILKLTLSHCTSLVTESSQCFSGDSNLTADAKDGWATSFSGPPSHAGMTKRGKWADEEAKSLGIGELFHLGDSCVKSQDRWKVFLLLYEMLEEYGTHLVEAAWTHQVSLIFQSNQLNSDLHPDTCGVYQAQMETLEGIFSWLAVLWERGFSHENPQVRCLIMQSFLGIDWEKNDGCAQKVPRSFVLGPFIHGLNDVVHHKDFGVKGVYYSETIRGATKFLHEFSRQLTLGDRAAFVWNLASVGRQESFGRAGLMALAFCVASAACQSGIHSGSAVHHSICCFPLVEQPKSDIGGLISISTADLLDGLGIVIERSKQHFNPNYRLKVCEQVLKAATSLVRNTEIPLELLLHFLSTVPREFTDVTGPLRGMVQQWLTEIDTKGPLDTKIHLLKNLIKFPTSFVDHEHSPKAMFLFDDEDVDAWEAEAQRWARVLLLVVTDEQHLEPIFMFLQNCVSALCKEDRAMNWIPVKLLVLILSLVEEIQIVWRKVSCQTKTESVTECDKRIFMDYPSPRLTFICEMSIRSFLPILGELVTFAKLESRTFWSMPMAEDMELPVCVKGKLGGPSQRRLASLMTSAVLQAIVSMRTVASVSSWCNLLGRDNPCDSPFTFLWDFAWEVIQSPAYDFESGGEIRLAAYEALTYVLKALSTAFTPSRLDYVMACNESKFSHGKVQALLDPLVLSFLHNINDLLATGVFTRSRRAVLMNWKWLCLDSLLSIPYNVSEKRVHHPRSACSLFSDSTVGSIFCDIVESLENAGESSVLPMLRSVRLVLGLLYSSKICSLISSCAGVDCQMMLQLVQSSWILHISCNKRRVAHIAALLSAVLHQSVFSDLSMHEPSGSKQGPLKWFIEKLLDEGVKSPRTIRLAALHLTGLWLLYPKTIKYYIQELKLLSLYGSVAFDEDFEAELSANHEATIEVSLLAQSPDREFTEFFINTEMYARVSVAVLFYKLAKLANMRREPRDEDSLAALNCGKMFLLELLDSAVHEKDLAKELYKKYSGVHRRKVRVWQMICILSHFVEQDIVQEVTNKLHICLYRNNLPVVRQYLESFATQIYLKFPSLAEEELLPIFYNYNMRPQALSSYVFIAANVIIHASELSVRIKHLNKLLPPIIPLLTSHHHSLRGFTQLLVYHVLCKLWPVLKPNGIEVASLEKKCFLDLKSYLRENTDCLRLRASMEGFLDSFDPNKSATPAGVFNVHNEGSEFECVPISLMEHVTDFLNDVRNELRCSVAKDTVKIRNESLLAADASVNMEESTDGNIERVSPQILKGISPDFQKKITISGPVSGSANSSRMLFEIEKEDQLLSPVLQSRNQAVERFRQSQQEFILVASLVDRIPNLAGLARTCEVFKASGLAIADASIMQDKQFQLISVTAEKWVPIIEVPVHSIKIFLEKKRQEGFAILGLEQTANSTPLDQYSFPIKTVLVLGREKEGIPVDIIHVLDSCVEIPQLGIVRSLNVHVSGAIALWEYTRQQRSRRP